MVITNAQTRNQSVFNKHFSLLATIASPYFLLLHFLLKAMLAFSNVQFIVVITQICFSITTVVGLSRAMNYILYYFKKDAA